MSTTVRLKGSQVTKDWVVIDAANRPLGRVASEVAVLLRGKHKPNFEPHLDNGDFVIVINASRVALTGRKTAQKVYYRHSGYPGGLRQRSYEEELQRYPDRVIKRAVWGMLPKGTLGEAMLKHLKVYPGETHPHQSQITGSERSRSAREEARAETLLEPRKLARLRPLSVPDGMGQPALVARATAAAPAPVGVAPVPDEEIDDQTDASSAALEEDTEDVAEEEEMTPVDEVAAAADDEAGEEKD
jgi:large subunit ribosomal protein L13